MINEHVSDMCEVEGGFSQNKMWELKKRIINKPPVIATAKKDSNGDLVTDPKELMKLYSETYKTRLEKRQVLPEYEKLKQLREKLFQYRLRAAKREKTRPWDDVHLDKVLKKLKNLNSESLTQRWNSWHIVILDCVFMCFKAF